MRTESGKNFKPIGETIASGSTDRNDESTHNNNTLEVGSLAINRRGSQGIKSILLKGEMRYLKDIDMLVFLCSPL